MAVRGNGNKLMTSSLLHTKENVPARDTMHACTIVNAEPAVALEASSKIRETGAA